MSRRFQGKVVVITGASAGVGRATARAFAREGARLALIARNQRALHHAALEAREAGGEAVVLPLDVADAAAVEAAAREVVRRFGGIDVWVNNAMVSVFSPALEMTADEFRRVTEVTYLGYVHGTLAAVRAMRSRGGTILQVGSALAYRSIPLQSAYCAAKAAVRGFTDSLRCEIHRDRLPIRLCMLQLPAVNTPQFEAVRTRLPREPMPVPPAFQPEAIAQAILRAARHPRREVWLGWPTVKAILAQHLVPGLADRYLAHRGYEAQQTDTPVVRPRPDNLYQPLDRDLGAHGPFDAWAKQRQVGRWQRSGAVFAALAVAGFAVGARRWAG